MFDKLSEKIKSKVSLRKSYIAVALLAIFLGAVAYFYFHEYFYIFSDPLKIKNAIMSYGKYSVFAFLILQIIQVVAFFIPGEIIQIAGGYIFGTFYGSILSLVGITMGSAIVYGISRLFGKPLIKKIISEKHFDFFERILQFGSTNYVVFLLYLIPGIPKDVFGFVCGISEITFRNFMIYSTLGRIPAIIISAYFGAKMFSGKTVLLLFIAILMLLLFLFGMLKGDRIIKKLINTDKK